MNRIFFSYARGDDDPFVTQLHKDLLKAGFTVWFDRKPLMSRGLTFHQEIKNAIRTEIDRVIYIGGPKAVLSENVREEWKFALECDHIIVIPILRLGDYNQIPGELSLLQYEDFREDSKYERALARLIERLNQPNLKLGDLFGVPSLPLHFLARPDLMREVRDALLINLQKPQVITGADAKVGVQGMGGIGKSVLAAALARNREIRQSYPNGIVWVACGQQLSDDDLLKRQHDIVKHLGGNDEFSSVSQGLDVLRELLATKAVLLILDDVWSAADIKAFNIIGSRCGMLVTTRVSGIFHSLNFELVSLSLSAEHEALILLADAANIAPTALPPEALEVARACGYLPFALSFCGSLAREHGGDFRYVLEHLHKADLGKITDREPFNKEQSSILVAMRASVEMLSSDEQKRFAELAIFNPDWPVPEASVATLWQLTGNLDNLDTEDLLINFAERSLIYLVQKPDANGIIRRHFFLHDLLYDFATRLAQEIHGGLISLHSLMARHYFDLGLPDLCGNVIALKHLPYHACEANEINIWLMSMTDFGFLHTVVELVDVTEGSDSAGNKFQAHTGYYVILEEIERWLEKHIDSNESKEFVMPLKQVWYAKEPEFLASPKSIMPELYHELIALEPKQTFDRMNKKMVERKQGPIGAWCERERLKYENVTSPWIVICPPEPSETPSEYIFISYKRDDLPRIISFMHRIVSWGYHIWYDRGIPGGAEWDELIEEKVSNCKLLLVFLSEAAVESKWVRREIKFADSEDRPIVGIRLDKNIELKHGLKVVMNQYQIINATSVDFSDQLRKAIEYVRLL